MSPGPEVTPSATARNWPRRLLKAASWGLAFGAFGQTFARLGARQFWVLDALTHLNGPTILVAIVAAFLFVLTRRPILAVVMLGLALWQGSWFLMFSGKNPVVAASTTVPRIRILLANVLHNNRQFDALTALIRRERPDVVGLVEYSNGWVEGLDRTGIRAEFPYRVEVPVGGQGLAFWFRQPPHRFEPIQIFSYPGNPVCKATVRLGEGLTTIWLVHPPNPIGEGRERSNPDLVALAEQVGLRGGSQIVVGDLNRTEFSPFYDDFLAVTHLRDSRPGFGRQPSWPTWSPYKITLDHAFLSPDLAVIDRRIGPDIGSDHLPLIIDVGLASVPTNSKN